MGIMDNEGHDPLGFGNVLSRTDANDLRRLKIEHARLLEQFSHADAAIEQLRKEREDYKSRWLGSMTPEEAVLIHAENARLRARAERLRLELEKIGWMDEFLDAAGARAMMNIAREAVQADECSDEQKLDGEK